MGYVFVSPNWFFIYSIILESLFAVITLTVSYYAFKAYKLTDKRSLKLFSLAFIFFALSYIAQAVLNIVILGQIADRVVTLINLRDAALLNLFGLYAHALLFIIGLIILTYIQFKTDNIKIPLLLTAIILSAVALSWNKLMLFYLLSALLLLFIVVNYFTNFVRHRTPNTLLVLVAMIFLLFGALHYFFALTSDIYYVLGHVLEFFAYTLILANMLLILKHGKKTR